ncbi:acyl carrier protein [Nocardiopsis dassonvillei]|uniref:acyl carrier protein n=1 Tax=Nocardiopsis dassonvillei TaxID=2014 RepID=UPI0008FC9F3C|nr:acyl carrier protein [Nocardiopsis dassonvillei]APC37652.1 phosphopantetheine-binding protein [Nocardiopsis dassonvillei]
MPDRHIEMEELVELMSACAGVRTDAATASASTFDELGIDSLGVMGIVAEIERRVGRKLGADAEASPSPAALSTLVNGGVAAPAKGM